jgi:hypothetical protein
VKQKDIVYLLLAVVILLVAGYVGYTQLVPKKGGSAKGVEGDKGGVVPSELDQAGLSILSDPAKVRDFSLPVDFTGLGNKTPFGQ